MLVFAITFVTGRRLPVLRIDVRLLHGHLLSVCFHAAKLGKWTAANEKSGVIGHIGPYVGHSGLSFQAYGGSTPGFPVPEKT